MDTLKKLKSLLGLQQPDPMDEATHNRVVAYPDGRWEGWTVDGRHKPTMTEAEAQDALRMGGKLMRGEEFEKVWSEAQRKALEERNADPAYQKLMRERKGAPRPSAKMEALKLKSEGVK